jgi:indole-3-glycerol phosphate synthase
VKTRFIDTLHAAERPLIMEIKLRDPHGRDLLGARSVADLVTEYEAAQAACISVVTGKWFGGSLELLREVAELTRKPLLQKDFITRRDQIGTARQLGASAVLLTAGLLPRSSLRGLVAAALTAGLTPFVEVTSEAEIEAVPHAQDCVIAVNNKDINDGERGAGDPDRSARLLPAVLATGACPVSASGIETPQQAADLLTAGYAGLLVGTTLMRAASPRAWFDDLRRRRVTR